MDRLRIAALMLLVPLLAEAASMYRWVDARGHVHYSQSPPPGFNAEEVKPAPPPAANPGVDAMRNLNQANDKAAAEGAKQKAEADQKKAEREGKCQRARERLDFLSKRPSYRIATKNPDGSHSRMTTEEYDKQLAEAQQAAADRCN